MLLPAFAPTKQHEHRPTITALPELQQADASCACGARAGLAGGSGAMIRNKHPHRIAISRRGLPKTSIAVTRIGWAGTLMV
jgi:hypothetical protein